MSLTSSCAPSPHQAADWGLQLYPLPRCVKFGGSGGVVVAGELLDRGAPSSGNPLGAGADARQSADGVVGPEGSPVMRRGWHLT
jgi:hypothetical protein